MNADEQKSPAAGMGDAIREQAAKQQQARFERIFGAPPAEETPADDSASDDGSDGAGTDGT